LFFLSLVTLDTSWSPPKPDKANTRQYLKKKLFKEIDTYHDPQFSVMDVLGGINTKLQNVGRHFTEV